MGDKRMINVTLKDGREFDVEYNVCGCDHDMYGRAVPEVEIVDVRDAEGNEMHVEDFSEAEQDELFDACGRDAMENHEEDY